MPDETGTETARSDAPGVDDCLFGDAPDDSHAGVAEEQVSTEETEPGEETPDDAGESDADGGPEQGQEDSGPAEEQAVEAGEDAPENDLKVIVSIKGSRATIGVQRPSSDPHIESFDDLDESGLMQEVAAVIERARARWEESPKHPAHERPAPPARRRNRRAQETAQAANAEAETEQAQQQTLRLF